jgi:hypothetical protein
VYEIKTSSSVGCVKEIEFILTSRFDEILKILGITSVPFEANSVSFPLS